jgi:hypothetical protein
MSRNTIGIIFGAVSGLVVWEILTAVNLKLSRSRWHIEQCFQLCCARIPSTLRNLTQITPSNSYDQPSA